MTLKERQTLLNQALRDGFLDSLEVHINDGDTSGLPSVDWLLEEYFLLCREMEVQRNLPDEERRPPNYTAEQRMVLMEELMRSDSENSLDVTPPARTP